MYACFRLVQIRLRNADQVFYFKKLLLYYVNYLVLRRIARAKVTERYFRFISDFESFGSKYIALIKIIYLLK